MPNVIIIIIKKNLIIIKSINCLKVKSSFHEKLFQEEKNKLL